MCNINNMSATKLYRHDCAYDSCPKRWSKFPNHEEDQENLKKETASDPIVHRHIFHDNKWQTQSFTIQCPHMRDHLLVALDKYQDFDAGLEGWTFSPPYKPIVHRWEQLNALVGSTDAEKEPEKKAAIDKLMEFLNPIVAPSVKALAETRRTGKIGFEDVWQIFPPGDLVMTSFFGVPAVCRTTKYKLEEPPYEAPYWVISLEYLDWNGERCGYASTTVNIRYFGGARHVVQLPVYPLEFNKSAEAVRAQITERGRKFEKLRGYNFQKCVGTKILLETKDPEERPEVMPPRKAGYITHTLCR